MRIAYIAGTALPSRVASAVNVMGMCRAFAAAGHEVTLYARGRQADAPAVFEAFGMPPLFDLVLRAPPALPLGKNLLYPLLAAREMAARPAPDLLYGRHAYALAAAAARIPASFVYEAHALPRRRARRLAESWLFRHPRMALMVAISRSLADDYAAAVPALAGRPVMVAHDGADPLTDPGPPPEPWPGRPGAPQLGYVGHLYPGKGMETVAALAEALPECDLHAVGGMEADIAAWRSRLAGGANLHFHGHVAHARVPAYLARFDLLLAPPAPNVASSAGREIGRWMSPLKLFEYMAAGRPILASDIPALREILAGTGAALLLPPGDAAAWASAARALLADPARAAALGARARAVLLETYTWDARAARILARLREGGA
ncbi:glycosyltransferase family 4 protein [Pararoseomonas indoligenes]|uniref:Glycosyltransferase family 4 protein n=1 Tax=Roseomonas indoligenes TaxID=2820811 RepID=A0A940S3S1_9PROT|nr:glycosyltransferase family 4 protein [Pararoseomonas indoligenes]MBP0491234.1 glycosyltransferase family 4 protein [Pararoseomonas indoligenes]